MSLFKKKPVVIKIQLTDCDYAPEDMDEQLPVTCTLIRMIPGKDRPDYWLAKCEKPLRYNDVIINYIVIAPKCAGIRIKKGMHEIALAVAYVTDETLLEDSTLCFEKCKYVAICDAKEITGRQCRGNGNA